MSIQNFNEVVPAKIKNNMGRNPSSMEQTCKKHPTHKQSKGVCPSCLREKLSQISTSSSSSTTNHSNSSSCSSLSPYLSDSNVSSAAIGSPLRKMAKTTSFSSILRGEIGKPLKKSRSLAFVVEEKRERKKKEKEKERFWSKLLGGRKGKKDVLRYSKTLKEKSSTTKWALFA